MEFQLILGFSGPAFRWGKCAISAEYARFGMGFRVGCGNADQCAED